ncbi:MAG TPA: hypothetical protein VH062_17555 [Polyangiaceae bacterium]|jgi:transcriptional regulator with XRE-family HTH domain|nr:hypothetical protein [Polyangiaceae bacterium]
MSEQGKLKDLKARIEGVDLQDAGAFHEIVGEGMLLLRLDDTQLARQFDMSRPSVNRWRSGRNAPHPSIRKHVYAFFKKKVAKLIDVKRDDDDNDIVTKALPRSSDRPSVSARGR